jgi:transposase
MSKTSSAPMLAPATEASSGSRRRSFTAEYKAKIPEECDAASEPGRIGEILRREGLYSSHLVDWRRRRAEGGMSGLRPRKSGRPPINPAERAKDRENERLRREVAALKAQLRRAEIIVEAQRILAELLAPLADPTSGSTE